MVFSLYFKDSSQMNFILLQSILLSHNHLFILLIILKFEHKINDLDYSRVSKMQQKV